MKKIGYIFCFIFLGFAIPACVDDTAPEDAFGEGPNLVSFTDRSRTLAGVANGSFYEFEIPMLVKGPSMGELGETITANISVSPSSTAVEGVHFELDSKTVTFSPGNNYRTLLPVRMLTDGIVAPLDGPSPVLVLNVSDVSGESNIIANGSTLSLTLNYLCFSDLAGTYNVTVQSYLNGTFASTVTYVDEVRQTGDGEYRGVNVGHWGDLGVGNPGFTFRDVCNEITIPEQNLVDYYSNIVLGMGPPNESYVDPDTGIIYMNYTVCASGSCRENYTTYVPM